MKDDFESNDDEGVYIFSCGRVVKDFLCLLV